MDFHPLKYIYRPSGNPAAYTLLLLHGTGGNEGDLIPMASRLGEGYNILSVRGNVSENGMPRFFRRLGMGVFDEADLHFRTDELLHFVESAAAKEEFDPGRVIALGYSNGANIAGAMLVKHPGFLAGAVLYRPMQPFKAIPAAKAGKPAPVFFSIGTEDTMVSPEATVAYLDILHQLGFNVAYYELNAGHNLTTQDISLAAGWLAAHFGNGKQNENMQDNGD